MSRKHKKPCQNSDKAFCVGLEVLLSRISCNRDLVSRASNLPAGKGSLINGLFDAPRLLAVADIQDVYP